jgi:hypothetical protein
MVGHKCTYKGREPNEAPIQKIFDWPICPNLLEVHGFLWTMRVIRLFLIENYAMHSKLTKSLSNDY